MAALEYALVHYDAAEGVLAESGGFVVLVKREVLETVM